MKFVIDVVFLLWQEVRCDDIISKNLCSILSIIRSVRMGFRKVASMVAAAPTTGDHRSRPMIVNALRHCEAALVALKMSPSSVRLSGSFSLLHE